MARSILALILAIFALHEATHAAQTFDRLDESRLMNSLESYKGTPYLYGGTSRSGIDCSGLVLVVYREQGVTLPRTSRLQARVGQAVDAGQLRVGDLIFFNTSGRGISHVGIATGPDTFVHGSTSRGVVEDRLSKDYWRSRYITARRVATPSTYLVSGDRVGAAAGDRVAAIEAYPFTTYELVNVPTIHVGAPRSVSVQFRTNMAGDVIVHPQASLWNRVQVAAYQRFEKMLGGDSPDLRWPDVLVKLRINNQWGRLPGFAVGYDTRRLRLVHETGLVGDSLVQTRKRGLFLVGSGSLYNGQGMFIGRTSLHVGGSMHAVRGFAWRSDLSAFAGMDQQLFRRVTLMGEIDNAFGEGGWHVDFGARLTITDNAVIEYSATFVGKSKTQIDKILKFTFKIPY